MKYWIHFVGKKESFITLLAILHMEKVKNILIFTESVKRAKILGRKLELNAIENSLFTQNDSKISVSNTLIEPEKADLLIIYSTHFYSSESICSVIEKVKNCRYEKVIMMMPEAQNSVCSELPIPWEYYFIDEEAMPSDNSAGLSFIIPE